MENHPRYPNRTRYRRSGKGRPGGRRSPRAACARAGSCRRRAYVERTVGTRKRTLTVCGKRSTRRLSLDWLVVVPVIPVVVRRSSTRPVEDQSEDLVRLEQIECIANVPAWSFVRRDD